MMVVCDFLLQLHPDDVGLLTLHTRVHFLCTVPMSACGWLSGKAPLSPGIDGIPVQVPIPQQKLLAGCKLAGINI